MGGVTLCWRTISTPRWAHRRIGCHGSQGWTDLNRAVIVDGKLHVWNEAWIQTCERKHVWSSNCCWIFVVSWLEASPDSTCYVRSFLGISPRNNLRFTEWYRRKIGDSFGILSSTLGWIKQVLPCFEPLLPIDRWSHLFSHVLFLQFMRCWPCVFKKKLCSLKNQHKVKWAHWTRHNFTVS